MSRDIWERRNSRSREIVVVGGKIEVGYLWRYEERTGGAWVQKTGFDLGLSCSGPTFFRVLC